MGQSILNPYRDSFVDTYYATTNFGDWSSFKVGEYVGLQYPKGLISFDVSALVGLTITSVILQLTANYVGGAGNTFWAYKLLHNDWVEAEVTFEEKSSGVPWTSGDFSTSDYTVVNGVSAIVPSDSLDTVEWDITVLVQDAIDNAIYMNLAMIQEPLETDYSSYWTKDFLPQYSDWYPKLIVSTPVLAEAYGSGNGEGLAEAVLDILAQALGNGVGLGSAIGYIPEIIGQFISINSENIIATKVSDVMATKMSDKTDKNVSYIADKNIGGDHAMGSR